MANNDIYYNAAYNAFIQATLEGRDIKSQTPTDYLNMTQAAQAFALEVDSKIALDALVSGVGGIYLIPANATITADQDGRSKCLMAICMAVLGGRAYASETQNDYDDIADAIAAAFTQSILLLIPG